MPRVLGLFNLEKSNISFLMPTFLTTSKYRLHSIVNVVMAGRFTNIFCKIFEANKNRTRFAVLEPYEDFLRHTLTRDGR